MIARPNIGRNEWTAAERGSPRSSASAAQVDGVLRGYPAADLAHDEWRNLNDLRRCFREVVPATCDARVRSGDLEADVERACGRRAAGMLRASREDLAARGRERGFDGLLKRGRELHGAAAASTAAEDPEGYARLLAVDDVFAPPPPPRGRAGLEELYEDAREAQAFLERLAAADWEIDGPLRRAARPRLPGVARAVSPGVDGRAANARDAPDVPLGRAPRVSAHGRTSDHLPPRSRRADAFFSERARAAPSR